MSRAHYGLQALLYTVALHRYLRWRMPGYDPDRHLAGVLYLFLRGMAGADTPTVAGSPCGVFAWRPPGRLVRGAERRARSGWLVSATRAVADPFEARRAVGAAGLLREFNEIGLLSAADVHVAGRLGDARGRGRRGGGAGGRARGARRRGSATCSSTWRRFATPPASNRTSPSTCRRCRGRGSMSGCAVLAGERAGRGRARTMPARPGPPTRGRCGCSGRGCTSTATGARSARCAADLNEHDQRARRLQVIAGGPGTGKTTQVARIVAELIEQARLAPVAHPPRPPLVALAAPTGKAAARLQEAVHEETARLPVGDEIRELLLGLRVLDAPPSARLAAGEPQPVRARPRQSPAPRRRDRR